MWRPFCLALFSFTGLSGKLWYLQHNCVGDTIVYQQDSAMIQLVIAFMSNYGSKQVLMKAQRIRCINASVNLILHNNPLDLSHYIHIWEVKFCWSLRTGKISE